jgi:trk system potassium uptake protein TrkA
MRIREYAVIGLGNFGATVARKLAELKCKVTAIDIDKSRLEAIQEQVHVAILADATDRKFLESLDVGSYDFFVVSTGEDPHASILIVLHLRELGARTIIAKARSKDHAKILMKLGATEALIPEEQMALKLARSLAQPSLIDHLPLTADVAIAELMPPPKLVGKTLQELDLRSKYGVQIIAVKDETTGKIEYLIGGDYRIRKRDTLFILGKEADIERIRE